MSDFWAGYLWGRGSGDGPSLPPEIALLFGGLLVFVGVLYLLRDVFNAIAGVTQAHPVLSLLVVGIAAAGIGELVAVNGELDVEEKVSGTGALVLVLFGIFWVIGVLSGASSLDNASWPVQAVMMILSLVIVCGFVYMLVSLLRYRCQTPRGRAVRAASVVLFAWWGWISLFSLPTPDVPFVSVTTFLVVGTVTTLATGAIEA